MNKQSGLWTGWRVVAAAAGIAAGAVVITACSSAGGSAPTASPAPASSAASQEAASAASASTTVWLCRPGLDANPCEGDLTATVIHADGSTSTEPAHSADDPPVDCFYIYPTASAQQTANANFDIDQEEVNVARLHAARFSQVCRVYAPIYRQLTIAGLLGTGLPEGSPKADPEMAYQDVVSAWQDYLANDNHGRGVVLIGHSQGSFTLARLIRDQIDNNPDVRSRLVSAILPGGNITALNADAPAGAAGASFANIPPCTAPAQLGCVLAYSTFPAMPPPGSFFGRVGDGATNHIVCTNPAALGGGAAPLRAYLPSQPSGFTGFGDVPAVHTPWVVYPDRFTGTCMSDGTASWLQVDDAAAASGAATPLAQPFGPGWGYHLLDISLALGNLVDVVGQQGAAWQSRGGGQ